MKDKLSQLVLDQLVSKVVQKKHIYVPFFITVSARSRYDWSLWFYRISGFFCT